MFFSLVSGRLHNGGPGSVSIVTGAVLCYDHLDADMAELADAPDLGSGGIPVQVRVLLSALFL